MPLANARSCRPSDLRVVSATGLGAAMSNTLFAVTLRNISGSPCTVIGYPTVSGVDAHGVIHRLTVARGSYFGDPGPPANIAPGDTVRVNVSGGDACQELFDGHHLVYPTLRLSLPSGGTIDVDGTAFDAICGVSVSAFGVPSAASPPTDVPPSPLTASISAPPDATPGTTLRYIVTLTNPTTTAYPLTPCPAYEEYVGSAGPNGSWVGTFVEGYLNCDAVASILPGESVSFAMELALPANQPVSDQAKFGWHLQGDAGPFTAASLRIEQP